jgi:hypothetical protein
MLVLTSAGRSLLVTLMLFVSANKRDWLNTRLGVLDVFTLNVLVNQLVLSKLWRATPGNSYLHQYFHLTISVCATSSSPDLAICVSSQPAHTSTETLFARKCRFQYARWRSPRAKDLMILLERSQVLIGSEDRKCKCVRANECCSRRKGKSG